MESNLLIIVGIGLAAMFFGYFFGLFEGRGQGYKRRKKEEAAEKAAAPSTEAPAPAPVPAPRDQSLLRLALDGSQTPVLELDGRRADVSALGPDQRKRLIDLMLVMRPWVEAAPAAKPSVASQPAPRPTAAATPSSGPLADRLAAAANPTPSRVAAPAPAPSLPASSRPAGGREAPEPGLPTTMVGQIDAILQSRLAGTPLAGRGIRVIESLEGGAAIMVGTQRYPGVGDVPDAEVKAAIKAAIAEWEEKYTPS